MNVFYNKCTQALDAAADSKTFAVFHSTDNTPNLNIHTHECCEVFYCLRGGKNFLIDDKIYRVHDGDIFIMNQFEAHKVTFEPNREVERYVFEIHPEFIFSSSTQLTDLSRCFYTRRSDTSNRLTLTDSDKNKMQSFTMRLYQKHSYGDDIIKTSVMSELLVFINKKFADNHPYDEAPQNTQLAKAIIYINEHLKEDLSLDIVAKNSYISVNQLSRLFKLTLGTTVNKYIVGKRITDAKKLLNNGLSVSDAAYECGFRDYSNFIRTFNTYVGMPPGKYKNISKGKQ